MIFEQRKESNPCSLCAKMRKGALNDAIKKEGCNKVAYAHHKDDVVETMLMSLIYEGRFHTFSPVTYLDRTEITVIRPLLYMNEADVIGFVNKNHVPVVKSPCPADGHTKTGICQTAAQTAESGKSRREGTDVYSDNDRQSAGLADPSEGLMRNGQRDELP